MWLFFCSFRSGHFFSFAFSWIQIKSAGVESRSRGAAVVVGIKSWSYCRFGKVYLSSVHSTLPMLHNTRMTKEKRKKLENCWQSSITSLTTGFPSPQCVRSQPYSTAEHNINFLSWKRTTMMMFPRLWNSFFRLSWAPASHNISVDDMLKMHFVGCECERIYTGRCSESRT